MPENSPGNALLRNLDISAQQQLLRNAELKQLETGHLLFRTGTPAQSVYFPERGIASLVTTAEDGAQVETGIVGQEGAVGLTEVLTGTPIFPHTTIQVSGAFWKVNAAECRTVFGAGAARIMAE